MEAGTVIGLAGLFLALCSIVVAIAVYRWSRPTRHLDYELLVKARLIIPGAAAFSRLELRYEDQAVEDPHVFVVRLVNSGKQPITAEEQHEHLALDFGEGVRVLTAEIMQRHPKDLNISVHAGGRWAVLDKTLLNPEDWLAIKVLTDREADFALRGRIAGVTEFRKFKPPEPARDRQVRITVFSAIAILAFLSAFTLAGMGREGRSGTSLGWIIGVLVPMALVAGGAAGLEVWTRRMKKRADAMRITF